MIRVATAPSRSSTSRSSPPSVVEHDADRRHEGGQQRRAVRGPAAQVGAAAGPRGCRRSGPATANGSVYASGSTTSDSVMNSHQPTISKPTASQNRLRRWSWVRSGRVADEAEDRAEGGQQRGQVLRRVVRQDAGQHRRRVAAPLDRGRLAAVLGQAQPRQRGLEHEQRGADREHPERRPGRGEPGDQRHGQHEELAHRRRRTASPGSGPCAVRPATAATRPTPTALPSVNRVSCCGGQAAGQTGAAGHQADHEDHRRG